MESEKVVKKGVPLQEGEEVTRNKNITCKEYSHAKGKNGERYQE